MKLEKKHYEAMGLCLESTNVSEICRRGQLVLYKLDKIKITELY